MMKSSKTSSGAVNNVSANKIANGFPDFHHKMSKKIAQLTKVIYHLNTKNDDHEFQLNSLADAYESEIEDVWIFLNIIIDDLNINYYGFDFIDITFTIPITFKFNT